MSDVVQQIKDKLNIIDVIAPYVELKRSSKNFVGRCPFHQEKTPSFNVSPDRGMYHCYGCGVGGDVFNFVQAMEGVDFKESLKILAVKAGVELVPEDPQKRTERDRFYGALEAATIFYSDALEKETEALQYLEARGVKAETIAKWRIGYAPGPPNHGWREGKEALEAKGFTKDELFKTGIIKGVDSGKEPFDVFRDRIVFPMSEPGGKVVAFSGRILHPDDKAPKYVNSPETELYKKSDLLYGYDKAKTGIRSLDFSLIVEGQFDVVMCHQAGYTNTVAVSGTALTLHHVQLLERMSDKVVLALDADKAGVNAMKKGATLMLGRGLDVKVAEMPNSKDPADIIQSNPVEFKNVIGRSVHVIEFLLHTINKEQTEIRNFRAEIQKEIYPVVLLLPTRNEQYSFAEVIAKYAKLPIDVVWHEIERLREEKKQQPSQSYNQVAQAAANAPHVRSNLTSAHAFLLASFEVIDQPFVEKIKNELEKVDTSGIEPLSDSEYARVVFTLEQQFAKLPDLALRDELVAKFNQLIAGMTKLKVSKVRAELIDIELSGDQAALIEKLKEISVLEKKMREPVLRLEDLE